MRYTARTGADHDHQAATGPQPLALTARRRPAAAQQPRTSAQWKIRPVTNLLPVSPIRRTAPAEPTRAPPPGSSRRVDGRPRGNRVRMRTVEITKGDAVEGDAGVVCGLLQLPCGVADVHSTARLRRLAHCPLLAGCADPTKL